MERVTNAHRRGAVGVAMIGLMRDARLRVSEAAALTWGDLEIVPGGSGHLFWPWLGLMPRSCSVSSEPRRTDDSSLIVSALTTR